MNEEQEKIVLENQNLVYLMLQKYHLYEDKDDYFDLGILGLIKGAKTFDKSKKTKLSTYLCKCISNEILQYLRKKRVQTVSINNVVSFKENITYEDTIEDTNINIEEETAEKVDFENISLIINELSSREQFVINHIFGINGYEELSQQEIAVALGISQAQVSRLKEKIILDIRKRLNDD